MQSKAFTRLSYAFIAVISIYIFVWMARKAADKVPLHLPDAPTAATTTSEAFRAPLGRVMTDIMTPRGAIHAMIATTTSDLERGLGGFDRLPEDVGMIFAFPSASSRGFWMQDMRFALDIVWIGFDKRVSGIARAVSPQTYPDVFYSPGPAQYVLELDSGGADNWGIATGTQLVF